MLTKSKYEKLCVLIAFQGIEQSLIFLELCRIDWHAFQHLFI